MVHGAILKIFADLTALVTIVLVVFGIVALNIFHSMNVQNVSNDLFREIGGNSPLVCTVVLLCGGYLSILLLIIILILTLTLTNFFEKKAAYLMIFIDLLLALISVSSALGLFGYINPEKCTVFENSLIFNLVENGTSAAFQRWKLDARCVSDVECTISAHTYIQEHCSNGFYGNLIIICLIIAFIFVAVLATVIGMILDPNPDDNSEE